MRIAAVQFQIQYEDKPVNLQRGQAIIEEAVKQGAEMILFPEMTFTGFSMDTKRTGEERGITLSFIQSLAKEHGIYVGFGWVKGKEQAENHYTLVGKDGDVLGDYVKIHPFSYSQEDQYFVAGDHLTVCDCDGIPVGLTICYDLRFPELYQALSKDAHVIVVPANWPENRREHWLTLLKARAIENQVYIIGVNCVGQQGDRKYSGDSCIITPWGECMNQEAKGECIIYYDLIDDILESREAFPTKKDRREDLYMKFMAEK